MLFFARIIPLSSRQNPACIKKTSATRANTNATSRLSGSVMADMVNIGREESGHPCVRRTRLDVSQHHNPSPQIDDSLLIQHQSKETQPFSSPIPNSLFKKQSCYAPQIHVDRFVTIATSRHPLQTRTLNSYHSSDQSWIRSAGASEKSS